MRESAMAIGILVTHAGRSPGSSVGSGTEQKEEVHVCALTNAPSRYGKQSLENHLHETVVHRR